MATPMNPYFNNFDHRSHSLYHNDNKTGLEPTSIYAMSQPQLTNGTNEQTQRQKRRFTPSQPIKSSMVGRDYQHSNHNAGENTPTMTDMNNHDYDRRSRNTSSSSFCPEGLKRRPSLREAARSFRSSRMAKRIRRHVMSDHSSDAEDDAGASASGSEHSGDQAQMYNMASGFYASSESQAKAGMISDYVNGLQSALPLRTNGRSRGSSSASGLSLQTIDSSDSASTKTSFTTTSGLSNMMLSLEDEDQDADRDDDSDRTGKLSHHITPSESEQPQLFACPFSKHDPKRYSAANLDELHYRGCAQSYLTDLARVKQHLYRVHERPAHHCPTCYEIFKSQVQCMKHVASQSCVSRSCPFGEKMTPDQLAIIKKKNRGTDPSQGWYEIFKTLFPKAQQPLSPYAAFTTTVDTLESFMELVIREVPRRLQHQVGYRTSSVKDIQDLLPDILRDIRRDFNPSVQSKPELSVPPPAKASPPINSDNNVPGPLLFYPGVVMDTPKSERPCNIDLPPPGAYMYTSTQHSQAPAQSQLSREGYNDQSMQQGLDMHYQQNQLNYNMENLGLMPSMPEPLTAIYQPEQSEGQHYFDDHHATQDPLPAFLLHIENDQSWIPNMYTMRMDYSNNNHDGSSTMGGHYHGNFSSS